MNIGLNIYELRREKCLTQTALAEKLGVSEQAVSKWENNVCAPDVSLFPSLAKLFGVSIDRIYGFHLDSYDDAVDEIIKEADDSHDTRCEIEIIGEGLKKYPNSIKLKNYLAFSYLNLHRAAENEAEKKLSAKKVVSLCNEIVAVSGSIEEIDSALTTLQWFYTETGEWEKAGDAIKKMSAEAYMSRITGKSLILSYKNDIQGLRKYAEKHLWKCWLTMNRLLEFLCTKTEKEESVHWHILYRKLLEIFDEGGSDFYATRKIFECFGAAVRYKALDNQEACLAELERFVSLANDVRSVAESESFNIAHRNKYFAHIEDEKIEEEYMTDAAIEKALAQFADFLGDNERFKELYKAR